MTLKLLKAKATHQSLQCFGHRLHSAIRPAVKWSGFHCTRPAVSGDAYLIVFIQTPLVQCISQTSCNQFCLCGPLENVLFPTIYERSTHMCRDFGGMTNDRSFLWIQCSQNKVAGQQEVSHNKRVFEGLPDFSAMHCLGVHRAFVQALVLHECLHKCTQGGTVQQLTSSHAQWYVQSWADSTWFWFYTKITRRKNNTHLWKVGSLLDEPPPPSAASWRTVTKVSS